MEKTFKENLREELNFQNLTVKELATKTGISKRSIENYLSKRESLPPADYAVKIAQVLGVTVEQLVTGVGPVKNAKMNSRDKHFIEEFRRLPESFQFTIKTLVHCATKK